METTRTARDSRRPRYGGNIRISEDPEVEDQETGEARRLEKGITRQRQDVTALAERLGVDVVEWYEENDVSAFKKKRIRLPDGRSVWRVIRPEFRRMLADYEDGKIDGIIFYDLDRLTRQNRDLEDLIDLVEFYKRPVESVTGRLDLRTPDGRAMARVIVAMANKASEDTARRVARAKLQKAQEGNGRTFSASRRPFGYDTEGTLISEEATLVRKAARRFLAGESWAALVRFFEESGIRPVMARAWSTTSIKQMLLSPSVAGIAVYNGTLRKENQERQGSSSHLCHDPRGVALKDAAGQYVRTPWTPLLSVDLWEKIVAEQERRVEGGNFSSTSTKKHLLSGLLRCGKLREDGTVCNRSLGGATRKLKSGRTIVVYRCPHKTQGGCAGTERTAEKLDKLAEDLLFAHIAEHAPTAPEPVSDGDDPDRQKLTEVQRRLRKLREQYGAGAIGDDTFFATVPTLEAQEKRLKAALTRKATARAGSVRLRRSPEEIRKEWDDATTSGKRAILGQYLQAIIVRESRTRGRAGFDYSAIVPVWKEIV